VQFTLLYHSFDLLNLEEFLNCIKYTELTIIGLQSYKIGPKSISAYAAKHFELLNHYLRACFDNLPPTFWASNTQNQTFFMPKYRGHFFGSHAKICVTCPIMPILLQSLVISNKNM
jgi:hypothetical protein